MEENLTFLNHSCVQLDTKSTKILCDPWFEGTAFDNGWSLLHNKSHKINRLEFDYIWISHEHPDHFSIPTLSTLTEPKQFLYQETKDKKVKQYLEKKGHYVIELSHKKEVRVGDFLVTCLVCDGFDSSLIVKYPSGKVVVNINDARVDINDHVETEILPCIGNMGVDVLLFQFSYANWAGNKGDTRIPFHQQKLVDRKNHFTIDKLKPKIVVPLASFVYFSHEENFYWNDNHWIDHIVNEFSTAEPQLILPTPNQSIGLETREKVLIENSNQAARKFWNKKLLNLSAITETRSVPIEELHRSYNLFFDNLQDKNTILRRLQKNDNYILSFYITDLNFHISMGLTEKFFDIGIAKENECAAEISSETFCFLMKNAFGRGSVSVNGRIQFNYLNAHKFFLFFFIFYANNVGVYFNEFSKITKEMLYSVSNSAVMSSILFFTDEAKDALKKDVVYLSNLFSNISLSEEDYEIFNEEPQNYDL